VWYKHIDLGGLFGQPIMWATLGKIDEINDQASAINDQIIKIVKSPVVVTSEASVKPLTDEANKPREGGVGVDQAKEDRKARDEVKILRLPIGSEIKTVPLDIGQGLDNLKQLLGELEADHPELSMYHELRSMSTVSGVAASRLFGDVANLVYAAEAAYDTPSISLFRMAVAITGYRVNNGDYVKGGAKLTEQHKLFAPFDLDSYAAGLLNFAIVPRLLVDPTPQEKWDAETSMATALNTKATDPGLSIPTGQLQLEAGYTEEQIKQFAEEAAKRQEAFGATLLSQFNSGAGMTPTDGSQASTTPQGGNQEGQDQGNNANPGGGSGQGGGGK
jgi:hypothetical protein